jgi:uncharacterized protein (TIGR00730 family)
MDRIAVFCGSSPGFNGLYRHQAQLLGEALANRGIELVYGGASVGLMGAVADGALNKGGKVTGVFPDFLQELEIAHQRLTELIIVESMHARKTRMNELSDGVIALPGGFGTLEELFEMLTWVQLGLIRKPIALLNISGYYNGLIEMIGNMVETGFLNKTNGEMLLVDDDIDTLLDLMHNYKVPDTRKWISDDEPPVRLV